jgi:hypothetical protein
MFRWVLRKVTSKEAGQSWSELPADDDQEDHPSASNRRVGRGYGAIVRRGEQKSDGERPTTRALGKAARPAKLKESPTNDVNPIQPSSHPRGSCSNTIRGTAVGSSAAEGHRFLDSEGGEARSSRENEGEEMGLLSVRSSSSGTFKPYGSTYCSRSRPSSSWSYFWLHVVEADDSLTSVAIRYNVPIDQLIHANRVSFPWAMESPLQWNATIAAPVLLIPVPSDSQSQVGEAAPTSSIPLDFALVAGEPTCSLSGPSPVYTVARGPAGVEFTSVPVQRQGVNESIKEQRQSRRLRLTGLSANGLPWEFPLQAVTGGSYQGTLPSLDYTLCVVPYGTILQNGKPTPRMANACQRAEELPRLGEGRLVDMSDERRTFSKLTLDLEGPQSLSLILPAEFVRRILEVVHP